MRDIRFSHCFDSASCFSHMVSSVRMQVTNSMEKFMFRLCPLAISRVVEVTMPASPSGAEV